MATEDDADLRLWLTRVEGKLDRIELVQAQRLDAHSREIVDHETRIRELESRSVVTPKGLSVALGSALTIALAFVAFVDRLTGAA